MKKSSVLTVIIVLLLGCGKSPGVMVDAEISSVTASGTLKDANDRFSSGRLIDGWKGCWCTGKPGGVGEYITLKLAREYSFKTVKVFFWNGFADEKYYKANNRIRDLQVVVKTKIVDTITLKDTMDVQDIDVRIDTSAVKEITFIIQSVYKGEKYDDTCLSEISFAPITPPEIYSFSVTSPFSFSDPGSFYTITLVPGGSVDCVYEDAGGKQEFRNGSWSQNKDGSVNVSYEFSLPENYNGPNESPKRSGNFVLSRKKGDYIYSSNGIRFKIVNSD
jgi:hypothetical protein